MELSEDRAKDLSERASIDNLQIDTALKECLADHHEARNYAYGSLQRTCTLHLQSRHLTVDFVARWS